MNSDLKKYLFDLISFPSITPDDAGAIDYIKTLLRQTGFDVVVKSFGNAEYQVKNLYARYGDSSPNICFAGHVDVVPPGDLSLWDNPPFTPTEIDGKIYGRGAVDMKGAIAAALTAALDFINSHKKLTGSISFLITGDEEGEATYGTYKMLEYLQQIEEKIDLVILGEPASKRQIADQIKTGRRGSINYTLKINGLQGHVAYPQEAINPVHILVKILSDLINIKLDSGSEFFSHSNLEITSVDVRNSVNNIIPETATAKFNIRFNNLQTSDSLEKQINRVIAKYTNRYELTGKLSAEPFLQQPVGIIAEFMQSVRNSTEIDTKFSTDGGTSDARFIHKYYPVIELGAPANNAHKINEHIANKDLQKLHKVYYESLCQFLNSSKENRGNYI